MPTHTVCLPPIIAALLAVEDYVGQQENWRPLAGNTEQSRFLDLLNTSRSFVRGLECISSKASRDVREINDWLREQGFNIQLDENMPTDFAAAAIMDLLVEWACDCQRLEAENGITHRSSGNRYPAFKVPELWVWQAPDHSEPILQLETRNDYRVCITKLDEPLSGFDLIDRVQSLRGSWDMHRTFGDDYQGAVIPMICLDERVDISWLIGLNASDASGPIIINQALQQTKLRMNEKGARVESAVAVGALRGVFIPKPPYVVDDTFLMWWTHPAFPDLPVFVGLLDEGVWADPGDLGTAK